MAHWPAFSVVIPAYQAEQTIVAALDSVFTQTHSPGEVIIADDGSTDATIATITGYRDNIRILRSGSNSGAGAARNKGWAVARGDFVAFLDADDTWAPRRLERVADLLRSNPQLEVVTTGAIVEEVGGKKLYIRRPPTYRDEHDRQLEGMLAGNFVVGGAVVRREMFELSGGFNETLPAWEDYELWLRLALGGARFGLVDELLYCYRRRYSVRSADRRSSWQSALQILNGISRDALDPREIMALEAHLRKAERGLLLADLLHPSPGESRQRIRASCLLIARSGDLPLTTRAKFLAAYLRPELLGLARKR